MGEGRRYFAQRGRAPEARRLACCRGRRDSRYRPRSCRPLDVSMNAEMRNMWLAKILSMRGDQQKRVEEVAAMISVGARFQGLVMMCLLFIVIMLLFLRALNYERGRRGYLDDKNKRW